MPGRIPVGKRQSTPTLTEHLGNAMLFSPTVMGIISCSGIPSVIHFSISPATCQGQAAVAVAAFAGFQWPRPQAPGIICASQFACLQKILNTARRRVQSSILSWKQQRRTACGWMTTCFICSACCQSAQSGAKTFRLMICSPGLMK